jgi:hypothetical protein
LLLLLLMMPLRRLAHLRLGLLLLSQRYTLQLHQAAAQLLQLLLFCSPAKPVAHNSATATVTRLL